MEMGWWKTLWPLHLFIWSGVRIGKGLGSACDLPERGQG